MSGLEKFCQYQKLKPESDFLICTHDKQHPENRCPYELSDVFAQGGERELKISHQTLGKRTTPCNHFVLYMKFFCDHQFIAKRDKEKDVTSCSFFANQCKAAPCQFSSSGIYQDKNGRIHVANEIGGSYIACDNLLASRGVKKLFEQSG